MQRAVLTWAVLASVAASASAQRIATETGDRTRIVHLKTELNHLTVIELNEPVLEVAAGSPAFKIEWRDNKVFLQPTEAEATTNLFIWTARQRLNYELEPASSVANMDFAVDPGPAPVSVLPSASATAAPLAPSLSDLLLAATPVRPSTGKPYGARRVEVWIHDVCEQDGRLLIRYTVTNHGREPYRLQTPAVYQLDGVRSTQSLYGLIDSQLGEEQVAHLKIRQQTPMMVVDGKPAARQLVPGEQAVGVVAVVVGPAPGPRVLRLEFPRVRESVEKGPDSEVVAFLVR